MIHRLWLGSLPLVAFVIKAVRYGRMFSVESGGRMFHLMDIVLFHLRPGSGCVLAPWPRPSGVPSVGQEP